MLSEFQGHHCQHRSDDFPSIAKILKPHKPRIVVELGTDRGGFGALLADMVKPWGGQVVTFDIEPKFRPQLLTDYPNLRFAQADVLGTGPVCPAARHPEVAALVSLPHVLLYCDNGDKKREVELYASLLQVGSILGVHDYNTEIMGSWVEPFVAALGYEPEGHARMEALRNEWYPEPMSRFWVRRRIVEPRAIDPTPVGIASPVAELAESSVNVQRNEDGSPRAVVSFKPALELPIDPEPEPPPFVSAEERAWFLSDIRPTPTPADTETLPSGDVAVVRRRRRHLFGGGE